MKCGKCGKSGWPCRESRWKFRYKNRNDKFKEWREVKIIENEHICKNLVLQI